MKRIIALLAISFVVFVGCNSIMSIVNPLIGTWSNETLGITTTLVLNANSDFTVTTTALGLGTTTSGTWKSDDTTITKTFTDGTTEIRYYTFNSDSTQMTLSTSPSGISTTYKKS